MNHRLYLSVSFAVFCQGEWGHDEGLRLMMKVALTPKGELREDKAEWDLVVEERRITEIKTNMCCLITVYISAHTGVKKKNAHQFLAYSSLQAKLEFV